MTVTISTGPADTQGEGITWSMYVCHEAAVFRSILDSAYPVTPLYLTYIISQTEIIKIPISESFLMIQ